MALDDKNEFLKDFALPESGDRQRFLVYLKIVFLPIVVYVPFVLGYFKVINFAVGLHTIVMMGVILLVALLFARHNAEYGCCVFEQQSGEFKRELKDYIMRTLLTIGKDTKSNASFDDFVENYSVGVRNENFAGVGAGVFPMLGILGTFISIAITMPNFSSSDTAALETEISTLLSGVGTAFYVSIYGIFLALWWIFFERFGISRFKKIVGRQKISTKQFFWAPAEINRRYMQESLGSFQKIGKVFEYVSNESFFDELDHMVERKYKNFEKLLDTEKNAIKLSGEHIKQTMDTLLKTQRDQKDLVRVHADIINVLHKFNQHIEEMQLKFGEQYARLQSFSDERIGKLERSVGDFGGEINKFETSLQIFSSEILEKQKQALEGFRRGMLEGMNAFKEIFVDEGNKGDESLALIEELKQSIAEIDADANEALRKLEANVDGEPSTIALNIAAASDDSNLKTDERESENADENQKSTPNTQALIATLRKDLADENK